MWPSLALLCAILAWCVACGSDNERALTVDGGPTDGPGICTVGDDPGERCDGLDNNCDGNIDELVTEFCPGCAEGTARDCRVWNGSAAGQPQWDVSDTNRGNFGGIMTGNDGSITLSSSQIDTCAVWIANTGDSSVSKLHCATGEELARYNSANATLGPQGPDYQLDQAPTTGACNTDAENPRGSDPQEENPGFAQNSGNCPSRTAVSQLGNAYVANRAFFKQGSVTKIAGAPELCRNGGANTSTGSSIVGGSEPDDCILWTSAPKEFEDLLGPNPDAFERRTPGYGAVMRSLAVGLVKPGQLEGDVWVGLYYGQKACSLDAQTGELLDLTPDDPESRCLDLDSDGPGGKRFMPYGAAADAVGRIWFVDRVTLIDPDPDAELLAYVDTRETPPVVVHADPLGAQVGQCDLPNNGSPIEVQGRRPYGMVIDSENRVYISDTLCGRVLRYSPEAPSSSRWEAIELRDNAVADEGFQPRGLAIGADNFLYVAISTDATNAVIRVNIDNVSQRAPESIGERCTDSWGVGLSVDESMWAVCRGDNKACRRDPLLGSWSCHAVGDEPYSYSDIAGGNLNLLIEDRGFYQYTVTGCSAMRWHGAGFHGEIPEGSQVSVEVRTANSESAFSDGSAGAFVGPFMPTRGGDNQFVVDFAASPGPLPSGQFLQVRLRLESLDRVSSPRLFGLPEIVGTCGGDLI